MGGAGLGQVTRLVEGLQLRYYDAGGRRRGPECRDLLEGPIALETLVCGM